MGEQEKSDHWDLLASELGAVPPLKEPEIEPAPPAERPQAAAQSAPPQPTGPATNWDALASELGVVPDSKPAETVESPARATEKKPSRRQRKWRQKIRASDDATAEQARGDAAADQSKTDAEKAKSPRARTKQPSKQSQAEEQPAERSQASKASHRAIPTWEEAIGVIVAANLQSRAKRPSGGSARGRGKGQGPAKG